MSDEQKVVVTPDTGKLNLKDIGKGAIVAILTPVLLTVYSSLQAGSLTFDWKQILTTGGAAGLGYLIKNFFTPAQTIIKN